MRIWVYAPFLGNVTPDSTVLTDTSEIYERYSLSLNLPIAL